MKHALFALIPALVLPTAVPAQTALPAWQLRESRDSFVVKLRGTASGFSVYATELVDGGYRVTENTQIGGVVDQRTQILLTTQQQLKTVQQSTKARGQEGRIDVHYHDGRVQGSAAVPGPEGVSSHVIDTAVPAGVVDDNLLYTVLPALPWKDGASWTVPVYSAGKDHLDHRTLNVVGRETLTLATGSFDTYRIEMRADPVVLSFWVARSAPHRVLKMTAGNGAFEMVRAN